MQSRSASFALCRGAVLALLIGLTACSSEEKPAAAVAFPADALSTLKPKNPAERLSAEEQELSAGFRSTIDRRRDLHGRVVDEQGAPVAGALIETWFAPAREFELLDMEYVLERTQTGSTLTNENGEFSLRNPRGRMVDLHVRAEGFAEWVRTNRYAGEFVPVRLSQAAQFSGTILDEDSGQPIAAQLRGFYPGTTLIEFELETDETGKFEATGLAPGERFIEVRPVGEGTPAWLPAQLAAGGHRQQDYAIGHGTRLHGRITNAKTGEPVADALVSETWAFWHSVRTDSDGNYALEVLGNDGFSAIVVKAPGFGRWERIFANEGESEKEVDVELHKGRAVSGRIFDSIGEPVTGAYVAAVGSEFSETGRKTDWRATRTDAEGRYSLDDLRADVPHTLFVRVEEFGTALYEFPQAPANETSLSLPDITLAPAGAIEGVIVDEHGNGVADAAVTIGGWNADREKWSGRRNPSVDPYLARRRGRTDDLGRFRFADLAPGTYRIRPESERAGSTQPLEVTLATAEVRAGLRFERAPTAVIEGRVIGPDGKALEGARVFARPEPPLQGLGVFAETGADGAFRLEGLERGGHTVAVDWPKENGGALVGTMHRGILPGGEDFEVQLAQADYLGGHVVNSAGLGVANAEVRVNTMEGEWVTRALTDDKGIFHVAVPVGGVFMVEAELSAAPPARPLHTALESVSAGDLQLELLLDTNQ